TLDLELIALAELQPVAEGHRDGELDLLRKPVRIALQAAEVRSRGHRKSVKPGKRDGDEEASKEGCWIHHGFSVPRCRRSGNGHLSARPPDLSCTAFDRD